MVFDKLKHLFEHWYYSGGEQETHHKCSQNKAPGVPDTHPHRMSLKSNCQQWSHLHWQKSMWHEYLQGYIATFLFVSLDISCLYIHFYRKFRGIHLATFLIFLSKRASYIIIIMTLCKLSRFLVMFTASYRWLWCDSVRVLSRNKPTSYELTLLSMRYLLLVYVTPARLLAGSDIAPT